METLQSLLNHERGKIKDPALATLVEELARENNGRCVITTRERSPEPDEYIELTEAGGKHPRRMIAALAEHFGDSAELNAPAAGKTLKHHETKSHP